MPQFVRCLTVVWIAGTGGHNASVWKVPDSGLDS